MTTVSKPNKKPARAAVNDQKKMRALMFLLPGSDACRKDFCVEELIAEVSFCGRPFQRHDLSPDNCRHYPNVLVRPAVIQKPSSAVGHQSFDKDNIWDLPNLLPFVYWFENRFSGTGNYLAWITFIEQRPAGSINVVVVGAVVNQKNAVLCDNRRGTGLYYLRVEHLGAAGQNGMIERIRPVKQVVRGGNPHLGHLLWRIAQIVHPILAINLLGNNGTGFGPTHIPFPFVCRQDDSLTIPMNEIGGGRHTELRVAVEGPGRVHNGSALIVVAGVGEIKGISDFYQARVFNPAAPFVGSLSLHDGLRTSCEMDSVVACRVA